MWEGGYIKDRQEIRCTGRSSWTSRIEADKGVGHLSEKVSGEWEIEKKWKKKGFIACMKVFVWLGRRDYWGDCDRGRSQKVSKIQGSDKMDMYSFILTKK